MAKRLKTHDGNGNGGTAIAELPQLALERRRVRLHLIQDSPFQKRRPFDPKKLEELAAAYRRGDPIPLPLARPLAGDMVQLVYGHRRLRAAELAELPELELNVGDMSDSQARHYAWEENAGREDLHPLDEADLFSDWSKTESAEEIAARVGRPASFVRARVKLAGLSEAARQAVLEDKIGLGQARIVAGLPAEEQVEALEFLTDVYGDDRVSVADLEYWLEERTKDLAKAPWQLTDAGLPGGACTACPKRTGSTAELFPGIGTDRCLDGACWTAKVAHVLALGEGVLRLGKGEKAQAGVVPRWGYQVIRELGQNLQENVRRQVAHDEKKAPAEVTQAELDEDLARRGWGRCASARVGVHEDGSTELVCTNEDCATHSQDLARERRLAEDRAKEAERAKKEKKPGKKKPSAPAQSKQPDWKAEQELNEAVDKRLLEEVMKKVPLKDGKLQRRELLLVAEYFSGFEVATVKGWGGGGAKKALAALKPAELQRFLVELALLDDMSVGQGKLLRSYAKELKINVKAVEAAAKLALEAEKKPAEKPARPKKKAKR